MEAKVDNQKKSNSIEIEENETSDVDTENTNSESDSNTGSVNGNVKKPVEKISKALKELAMIDNMKFMGDFDPELSNREKRKLSRKFPDVKKGGALYDDNGFLIGSEKDICDCLNENCPGCHFPCPKCRSLKCGYECRVNRKWMYEVVGNEGERTVKKNPLIPNSSSAASMETTMEVEKIWAMNFGSKDYHQILL